MISVILIWIYVLITVSLLGYGFANIWNKITGYQIQYFPSLLMAGLVVVTVYAQVYSLFSGVGLGAHVLMWCVCALIVWCSRGLLPQTLQTLLQKIKMMLSSDKLSYRWKVIGCLILFLLMAYGTSKGIMHYDTALYHAQSIRWIEEYGVIKGLGNLHCRLAYNSAAFALTAFYSMHFLGGQSFHVMAGFLALIVAMECAKLRIAFVRKHLLRSDYARIMGIYYLLIIFDEMVSPASDYFMVLTFFYLTIRWLSLLEEEVDNPNAYGLLCLLGVYLLTVKLSAALILILTAMPAIQLISQKKGKEIGAYLGTGLGIALPYLIRNVFISGWLIYPFTSIDLFPVDWKIPKGLAQYDAKEIQVWGRGYTDVLQYDAPITSWFGNWFRNQSSLDKMFIVLSLFSVGLLLVKYIMYFAKKWEKFSYIWVETTLVACFLFWLSTSPLIRYGCVYVWLTGVVIGGDVLEQLLKKQTYKVAVYWLLILFGCYKLIMFAGEIVRDAGQVYMISQKDYDNYDVIPYEVSGVTFYYAANGDQTGYEPFPSSPLKGNFQFRGTSIEAGLKANP